MREGWKEKTIGEVCDVVNGGTPKTGVSGYWGGSYQWITPAEMGKRVTPYIQQTERTITSEGLRNSSARLLPPHSVILSSRAPIGYLVINTAPMATNQGCKGLVPNKEIDHKFLFYYLESIVKLLNELGSGATFKELSSGKLKEIPIPIAPLPEQRRIVAILDKAFEGIATAKANIEKNLQNAREIFESHLNAVFSQRGEGWVDRRLGDVAMEFGRGKSKHRPRNDPKLYGGSFPFIQTGDVRNSSHLITSYDQTYNDAGLAQSKLWPKGTLCITIAANIAETGILDFDACFPDSIIGLVANEKISTNKYIEYLLTSFKSRLQLLGKGSAQDNINLATFESQYFPFPPLSSQKEIVSIFDDLHEETQHLESIYQQKLAALDELKQSLLHQAFNGDL